MASFEQRLDALEGALPAPVLQAIMKDVDALRQEMKAAGAWVFAAGLHPPSTATVVRVQDGQLLTTDGPFVEAKESVGSYAVVDVTDRDDAIALAKTWPAGGLVEVRPVDE